MNVSLYQAASAMNADARWQEIISDNLASASIPGYKKQDLSFSAVQAGLIPTANGAAQFSLPQVNAVTSFQQGELRRTGMPTDVAIDGSGFFAVQLPNGANGYTRDGEFHINAQGQLVTKLGYPVLSNGGPIQLDRNNPAPLSISATGEVSQGQDSKGKMKIVEFAKPQLLQPNGGGIFLAQDSSLVPQDLTQPSLRQGFLESANTSPVTEMANLISVMRSYEANQRLVQIQDDRMGRAITELGNPTS